MLAQLDLSLRRLLLPDYGLFFSHTGVHRIASTLPQTTTDHAVSEDNTIPPQKPFQTCTPFMNPHHLNVSYPNADPGLSFLKSCALLLTVMSYFQLGSLNQMDSYTRIDPHSIKSFSYFSIYFMIYFQSRNSIYVQLNPFL